MLYDCIRCMNCCLKHGLFQIGLVFDLVIYQKRQRTAKLEVWALNM